MNTRQKIALAILVGLVSLRLPTAAVATMQERRGLEEWRAHVASQVSDGSIWWTSNQEYVEIDGGIDAFGMRFEAIPGGVAARGCLWSIRGDETLRPSWEFFMAWDPIEEQAMLYQVSPGGTFGFGHRRIDENGLEVAEQTFRDASGQEFKVRHETRTVDEDTREGGSFDWVDGEWIPRRSYQWVRRPGADPPC
jgi:hypothetical protein